MMNILWIRFRRPLIISGQKRALACLFLFLVIVLAPSMVLAESNNSEAGARSGADAGGGASPGGGDSMRPRDPLAIYREAGINGDQENQIRDLAKNFEDANATRLQSVMTQLQEMKTLSLKPNPDETAVISKQEEISKLQGEMGMERIKLLLKIRQVLTPQQRERLVELMQKNMSDRAPN